MTERTLAIIKPDAVERRLIGTIMERIERGELKPVAIRMFRLSEAQTRQFYKEHTGKPFFEGLVRFMSSGPMVAVCLEGEKAISRWRTLMGPTDPKEAGPGTIRGDLGTNVQQNTVHGSDSPETAKSEIAYFFTSIDLP